MPAAVTLFEYEHTAGFGCTPRELAALDRLNRDAGAFVLRPVLVGGRCELQAAQYVGVFRLAGRTVQVLPKLYRKGAGLDDAERARAATRNLLAMLSLAGRLPLHEHALASLLRRDLDWFEALTRLFATHLLVEWQRGPARGYESVEEEARVLKGRWRIAEQVRRPERGHLLLVEHDEFQVDNALNRVFRFVVERLLHRAQDADNRRRLGELRCRLDEVTLLPQVSAADADPARLTRLQRRFAPLLTLARLFLDGGALQLAKGDATTFAFTFDMNGLFEEFVVGFVRRYREDLLPAALRGCTLLPQAEGVALPLARRDDREPAFRLRPDLLLCAGDRSHPLLLDTKYKRLDAAARNLGIAVADFHQLFAYAQRYRCPRALLLYPQAAGDAPLRAFFTLPERAGRIEVATLDLRRDLTGAEGRQGLRDELRHVLAGSQRW